MKLYTPDGQELMNVSAIRRDGNNLVVDGIIMGAMPAQAVLRPDEARSVFAVLAPGIIPFLLSFIFRRAGAKPAAQGNPLDGMLDDY
jgi:hypothetical protein